MLMELIEESLRNLCVVTDGGIMGDDRQRLKEHMLGLLANTDILVSSGGVSMGSRDFIKPILSEIGCIKFGRVQMKPGKPTTFAVAMVPERDEEVLRKKLIFGLPGNPVSASVAFKLLVDPAIRHWTGTLKHFDCQHPPISVEITKDIRMDPERPNYNRCVAFWDKAKRRFVGHSTGSQRSSRLLSMKSANCLLRVPQKEGVLRKGSMVKALVIGPLTPRMPPNDDEHKEDEHGHEHLMDCNCGKARSSKKDCVREKGLNHKVKVGVLTVSDRAAKGVYADESGPALMEGLKLLFGAESIGSMQSQIVQDEAEEIGQCLMEWDGDCHLVVTSGGTGFAQRDITPEVTNDFIHRRCPGIVHKMIQKGLDHTEFAALSRYAAGITKKQTLIINMPGSTKAVRECLDAIKHVLPHALNQINMLNLEDIDKKDKSKK